MHGGKHNKIAAIAHPPMAKEMPIKSGFVTPAKAGNQKNQQAGHRPAPV
jgi:hypothetical protein